MTSCDLNIPKQTSWIGAARRWAVAGTLVIGLAVPGVVAAQSTGSSQVSAMETARNKKIAVDCLNLIFNKKDIEQARTKCFGAVYIQHNPRAPDGPAAILDLFSLLSREHPDMSIEIKRVAADGDLVWVHYHAKNDANDRGRAVVDILRFADGKFVEHWDVSQPVPAESANNNTMF